jgi:hypothetical protein
VSLGKIRDVSATRKAHTCEACERPIATGSAAKYWAGIVEGEFYCWYRHADCYEAESAWNDHADFAWDEFCHLWHMFDEGHESGFFEEHVTDFRPTLQEKWPAVYQRLLERQAERDLTPPAT